MANFKDKLQDVVKGEISALETYDQVLEKFKSEGESETSGSNALRQMRKDHSSAVEVLKDHLSDTSEEVPHDSGAWGGIAKSVTGSAKLFGDKASLSALKKGEEHGENEYQELLKSDDIPGDLKNYISDVALPNQRRHINDLDTFINNI